MLLFQLPLLVDLDGQNINKLILGTAGVLDFLGCAWCSFHPPVGMYYVYFLLLVIKLHSAFTAPFPGS